MSIESSPHTTPSRFAWTRSLRFRLTLGYTGGLACVLFGAALVLYFLALRGVQTETDSFLSIEAHRLASVASQPDRDPDDITEALAVDRSVPLRADRFPGFLLFSVVYARFVDPSTGKVLAASPSLAQNPKVVGAMDRWLSDNPKRQARYAFIGPDEEDTMRATEQPIVIDGIDAIVQVAVPWDSTEDTIEEATAWMIATTVLVLIVAAIGCWVLVGRTLVPIRQIVTQADQVSAENLSKGLLPPPKATDSEVGALVSTLNRMTIRLHEAFEAQRLYAEAQRQFAADASHELRTPLTIMRGEADYALMRPRDEETYRVTLETLVADMHQLTGIVESLTLLARLDGGRIGVRSDLHPIDLGAIAELLVDDLRPIAIDKEIDLKVECDDRGPLIVTGDEGQIRLALRNLIDNALKYTPTAGRVRISVTGVDGSVDVVVKDTGIGISDDDLPHIFDRFWRADRSRTAAGTGLGLAIAAHIAKSYNGSLTVDSRLGVGSTFRLSFPASQ